MKKENRNQCSECKFFEPKVGLGQCRKYSPMPILYDDSRNDAPEHVIVWPSVNEDDWCGEFEPADGVRYLLVAGVTHKS